MGKKKQLAERNLAQASKSPVGSVVSKLRVRVGKTSVKTTKEAGEKASKSAKVRSRAATEVKVKRVKVPALRLKKPVKPAKAKALKVKPKPVAPAVPVVLPTLAPEPVVVDQRGPEPLPASFIDRGAPIPERYGYDRLVALVRDPQWIFGYWEMSGGLMERITYARGHALIEASAWVLRLHRIDEDCAIDMEIDPSIGNWYIHVGKPGRYQLELGLLTPDGEWISLLASNEIITPAEGLSDRIDEEWRLRPEDEERLRLLLMKELGLDSEGLAQRRGGSEFVATSRLLSSWKLAGSWLGGSWGGSASGRPVAGSWAMSFQGASGRPSSGGSGGFMNVGWIVGADGRHEPVLMRPSRGGGPNWHFQSNLPKKKGPSKSDAPHFNVKLPRLIRGAIRPKPTWPPRTVFTPPVSTPGKAATRAQTQGSSGKK